VARRLSEVANRRQPAPTARLGSDHGPVAASRFTRRCHSATTLGHERPSSPLECLPHRARESPTSASTLGRPSTPPVSFSMSASTAPAAFARVAGDAGIVNDRIKGETGLCLLECGEMPHGAVKVRDQPFPQNHVGTPSDASSDVLPPRMMGRSTTCASFMPVVLAKCRYTGEHLKVHRLRKATRGPEALPGRRHQESPWPDRRSPRRSSRCVPAPLRQTWVASESTNFAARSAFVASKTPTRGATRKLMRPALLTAPRLRSVRQGIREHPARALPARVHGHREDRRCR
jgi:hypothetical protein